MQNKQEQAHTHTHMLKNPYLCRDVIKFALAVTNLGIDTRKAD